MIGMIIGFRMRKVRVNIARIIARVTHFFT